MEGRAHPLPARPSATYFKETMATYATFDDHWLLFDPGSTALEADVEAAMVKAERDIDAAIGRRGYAWEWTERRIDPTILTEAHAMLLAMATCAQAQYRMFKGDEFFASLRPGEQSSREGRMVGQEPYIGPVASSFLSQGNFYYLVRGPGTPPNVFDLPNQNTGS